MKPKREVRPVTHRLEFRMQGKAWSAVAVGDSEAWLYHCARWLVPDGAEHRVVGVQGYAELCRGKYETDDYRKI